jgi:LmbE family N-acetylglucosaminyl deacetylase
MSWVYLSPHFDDVALSCGGLVWEQAQAGEPVSIWTVCAGDTPANELSAFAKELHTRWMAERNATAHRKQEDLASCLRLGAAARYFNIPDCIYRRHPLTDEFLYTSEAALNGSLHPGDAGVVARLRKAFMSALPKEAALISPLGLGNHVDHQLVRAAVNDLRAAVWYYEDYPYVLRCEGELERLASDGWVSHSFPISPQGLLAWQDSVAAHASQISTFWAGEADMRQAIEEHLNHHGGTCLWQPPPPE